MLALLPYVMKCKQMFRVYLTPPIIALITGFLIVFTQAQTNAPTTFSVASYNLWNWTNTDRQIDGKRVKAADKPDKAKKAVIAILKKMNPDILLIQEMGNEKYFKGFQEDLKKAGLDYPHTEQVAGVSPRITIALLSRYPIIERNPRTEDTFEISGKKEGVQRGFIDVLIEISPEMKLKVMNAHLKSKRGEDSSSFPSIMRRREALALRGYIVEYLTSHPDGYIIIGGDMNDTFGSEPLKTIVGERRSEHKLFDLWLRDWLGDRWTHNYDYKRIYSQIDFLIVNQNLFKHFVADKSYVYREHPGDPEELEYANASDHRPIMATFSITPVHKTNTFRKVDTKSEEKALKKAEEKVK